MDYHKQIIRPMKEIKIYSSLWRMMLLILACILFVLAGIFILHMHRNVFHLVVGWLTILFFGCCGIMLLFSFLKERLFGQAHLTINDEELTYRRFRTIHVRFAYIASFEVRKLNEIEFVAINYKPGVERQMMQDNSIFDYLIRSMNKRLIDAPDSISVTDISMEADELCRLLNEKVKNEKLKS